MVFSIKLNTQEIANMHSIVNANVPCQLAPRLFEVYSINLFMVRFWPILNFFTFGFSY